MNRYLSALFIASLIHLLLISIFYISLNLIPKPKDIATSKKIKISLKELLIKKPKQIKVIPKKKKSKITKKVKIIKPKPKLKKILKVTPKLLKQKIIIKKKKPVLKQKVQPKNPMAWLYEDKSTQENKQIFSKSKHQNSINQNIKELYGSKFNTLSKNQQDYILDNQEIMRRITQQVLNRVAGVNLKGNINTNTSNIVEFYLHPNGDMTDFKFLAKSSYFELDDTTKETIQYAYSKYPRPTEKTLIRYNVFYNLRH